MVLIIKLNTTGICTCHLTQYTQRYNVQRYRPTVVGVALRGTSNISTFSAAQAM